MDQVARPASSSTTCATSTALRDGHNPGTVAARLGHSPETLLRVYAQEIEQGQVGVAASLASHLDG